MRKAPPARGRPTPDGVADLARYTVMLDPVTVERLRTLSDGNLSAGIRAAAKRMKIRAGLDR